MASCEITVFKISDTVSLASTFYIYRDGVGESKAEHNLKPHIPLKFLKLNSESTDLKRANIINGRDLVAEHQVRPEAPTSGPRSALLGAYSDSSAGEKLRRGEGRGRAVP